jgi:hypothetical protein
MTMNRYYAKCISKSKGTYGIWDRESRLHPTSGGWVVNEDGTRWQSSQPGALIIAERWNLHGRTD